MLLHATKTTTPKAKAPARASASDFRDAMSVLATGVVLVTNRLDGRPWGTTVSAFASVSDDPPTILVSLGSETATARAIEAGGSFGVSILGRRHAAVARHCSTRGAAKFVERFADRPDNGRSPSIADALAHLDCDVAERVRVADHTLFVGRVRDVRVAAGGEPLVYFRRAYRTLARFTNPLTRRRIPCLSS
jgi:flavin reductase (DIM6/NTAB) family NADH-FMN oxidoreductase RutF